MVLEIPPPVAEAGLDKTVYVNQSVSFSATGSNDPDGTIIAYEWDFGDGEGATGFTVNHVFRNPGTYTVKLTVTDDKGAQAIDTAVITVLSMPVQTTIYAD